MRGTRVHAPNREHQIVSKGEKEIGDQLKVSIREGVGRRFKGEKKRSFYSLLLRSGRRILCLGIYQTKPLLQSSGEAGQRCFFLFEFRSFILKVSCSTSAAKNKDLHIKLQCLEFPTKGSKLWDTFEPDFEKPPLKESSRLQDNYFSA